MRFAQAKPAGKESRPATCFPETGLRPALVSLIMLFMMAGSVTLYAQNSMPIMQTFIGQYGNTWLGYKLSALDFNADGYDDLLVYSHKTGPNAWPAALLYFGSAVMDTVPDLVFQSEFLNQMGDQIFMGVGDINGDGYEDIMLQEMYPTEVDSCMIHFCYGGPNPDLVPDHTIVVGYYSYQPNVWPMYAIGDVNNDGCDDLGIRTFAGTYPENFRWEVMLGGVWQRILVVGPGMSTQRVTSLSGVGDVNGDGIDDFVVGYGAVDPEGIRCYRYLYFGGSPLNLDNRVLLYSTLEGSQIFSGAFGVGDVNHDGYDDMVYCTGNSYMEGNKLRLGGSNIMETEELTLHSIYLHNLMQMDNTKPVYGDFNADGFADIAGSDYEDNLWSGSTSLWLGKAEPNGTNDLRLLPPATSPYHQFGWAIAAGDFDGDGFDDLAVSAPQAQTGSPWYHGYVYVYSGNPGLQDTSVATDDALAPQPLISICPNPTSGNFSISTLDKTPFALDIYDLRGRKLFSAANLSGFDSAEHSLNLPSGIYLLRLQSGGKSVCKRLAVIK